jgi:predicted GNAT family N-acyltransferase
MSVEPVFSELPFGSPHQVASLALRDRVLRRPLGLQYDPNDLEKESDEVHLAALKGDRVLAILLLKKGGLHVMKMRQVAVDVTMQGSGIGSRLVTYSEKWCRQHQIKRIELHARATAVNFYQRLGYHIQGESFIEVGIEHYFMYKDFQ